jgi:hypothetical protein
MSRHEDAPWITFGSIYANTHDCRNERKGKAEAPLERMLWRRPSPDCREKLPTSNPWLCIGGLGRRKYVVNPRVVRSSQPFHIHRQTQSSVRVSVSF